MAIGLLGTGVNFLLKFVNEEKLCINLGNRTATEEEVKNGSVRRRSSAFKRNIEKNAIQE